MKRGHWLSASKRRLIPIAEMATQHIRNVIQILDRRIASGEHSDEARDAMYQKRDELMAELDRRKTEEE